MGEVAGTAIHEKPDGTLLYINSAAVFEIKPHKVEAKAPYVGEDEKGTDQRKWVWWGENDDLPNKLMTTVEEDTILAPGMDMKSAMTYGGGIAHGTIEISKNGEESFHHLRDEKFIGFMRDNNLESQILTTFMDLNYLANAYVWITLNGGGDKIEMYSVDLARAKRCRLSKAAKKGEPQRLIVNADFGTASFDEKNNRTLEVLPTFRPVEWLRDRVKKTTKRDFAIRMRLPDGGRQFYSNVAWQSVIRSKWNEIQRSLSAYKKCLLENQMTLKYHITVHPRFWGEVYGKKAWDKSTHQEKNDLKKKWLDSFTEFMQGAKGVGNSLLTEMHDFVASGGGQELRSLVDIKPIDSKFRGENMYIEDSREAVLHHMSALGLHPELQGAVPASQMGSGSGSSARVAFNQRVAMAKPIQDIALYPLGIVRDFNGWDSKMVFRMRNSLINTLDTGAEATKPTPNT